MSQERLELNISLRVSMSGVETTLFRGRIGPIYFKTSPESRAKTALHVRIRNGPKAVHFGADMPLIRAKLKLTSKIAPPKNQNDSVNVSICRELKRRALQWTAGIAAQGYLVIGAILPPKRSILRSPIWSNFRAFQPFKFTMYVWRKTNSHQR